jgi:hypothetical protein
MIGVPYNPNNCIFITNQALNADQFNPNVPDAGNTTTHNMLWDTANKSLIWVDTKTNLIVFEINGGGGLPFGNDVGVVDAYQAIISGATLTDGYAFEIKIANTNTGASTLQINALGVLPFVDVKGDPFGAGMIEVDSIYIATYNSTFNAYQLLGESRPGVAITNDVIPKGNGVSIVDGSWSFAANDIIPNVSGSNIGDDTHRVDTIFMASNIDYANDLVWKSAGVDYMTLTTAGDLGIGVVVPTARLQISGIDATNANYALKVEDNVGTPILYSRNDGKTSFNTSTFVSHAKVNILGSLQVSVGTYYNSPNTLIYADTTFTGSPADPNKLILYNAQGSIVYYVDGNVNLASHQFFTTPNGQGTPRRRLTIEENGFVSIGDNYFAATAQLHIRGFDNTIANYALRVENNVGSPLLVVNNAGLVGIGISSPTNYLHIVSPFFAGGMQVNSANTSYLNLYGVGGGVINMGAEFGATPLQIQGTIGVGGILRVTDGFAIRNFINNVGIFRAANVDTYPNWAMGDHLGGTIIEANTRLVIYGQNVLATDYILKLKDGNGLGPVDVFTARNDGRINMAQLPVSNVGLISGDIWNNAGVVNIV